MAVAFPLPSPRIFEIVEQGGSRMYSWSMLSLRPPNHTGPMHRVETVSHKARHAVPHHSKPLTAPHPMTHAPHKPQQPPLMQASTWPPQDAASGGPAHLLRILALEPEGQRGHGGHGLLGGLRGGVCGASLALAAAVAQEAVPQEQEADAQRGHAAADGDAHDGARGQVVLPLGLGCAQRRGLFRASGLGALTSAGGAVGGGCQEWDAMCAWACDVLMQRHLWL